MLREVARKTFRLAKAVEATLWAVHRPPAKLDRRGPTSRMPRELRPPRFVELLTRSPRTRIGEDEDWGYGFFRDPSAGSYGDCAMSKASGIRSTTTSVASR